MSRGSQYETTGIYKLAAEMAKNRFRKKAIKRMSAAKTTWIWYTYIR